MWFEPEHPTGRGVLVLAGSSGRVDEQRAQLFAGLGVVALTIRWFGMQRGGTSGADEALGELCWPQLLRALS